MSAPIRITGWYLRQPKGTSFYQAPETTGLCVAGAVFGHPKKPDGMRVTTSPIVRVEGRNFWTRTGSAYVIEGDPEPKYLAFLKSIGRGYDAERPLAVVGVKP
jgi:hypothetical protein